MIRGKTRKLNSGTPVISLDADLSIHNRFDIEVIDCKTGEVRQKAQAENVILNQLWGTYLNYGWNNYIHYGVGTGSPSATDTKLFTFSGSMAFLETPEYLLDDTNSVYSVKKKAVLTEGMAVGLALSEIGIGTLPTDTSLCTHAMLKDMNGNSIVINKTDTDIITIYATVFVHFADIKPLFYTQTPAATMLDNNFGLLNTALGDFSMYVNGDSHTIFGGHSAETAYKEVLTTSITTDNANKTITINIARVVVGVGNFHGITFVRPRSYAGSWVWLCDLAFVPPLWSGSNIVGEALGTGDGATTAFKTNFVDITNAKVYVDGIERATGVTVTKTKDYINNIAFSPAPASGAVLTIDYHTPDVAKDADHVFDCSITFHFGEYTP